MPDPINGPETPDYIENVRSTVKDLWVAAADANNQARLKKEAAELISSGATKLTNLVNGKAAPAAAAPEPPSATPAQPDAVPATPDAIPAKPEEKPPEKPAEENISWVTELMMKFLPEGVKDWAASMAVPMATQGQNLIQKFGKPKVSGSPAAYFSCMMSDKITEIPKGVHDYSRQIIKMLGLGENEDLAMALSVGFISFLRDTLSPYVPGIKTFNKNAQPPSMASLLGFGTQPETLVGIFKLAPPGQPVDKELLNAFKIVFEEQGVADIENYFPGDELNYSQFVHGYAQLGNAMAQTWNVDPAKISTDLTEAAGKTLEKNGITDLDGSLAQGLAIASIRGSELIKSMSARPVKPAPAAPTTAPGPAAR